MNQLQLYYNTSDFSAKMKLLENIKDLTIHIDADEAEASVRGNSGWRVTITSCKGVSVLFKLDWDTTDACFNAIRTAYLHRRPIAVAIGKTETQLVRLGMLITKFRRMKPLEEKMFASVAATQL